MLLCPTLVRSGAPAPARHWTRSPATIEGLDRNDEKCTVADGLPRRRILGQYGHENDGSCTKHQRRAAGALQSSENRSSFSPVI
jgi:hypothetical protein